MFYKCLNKKYQAIFLVAIFITMVFLTSCKSNFSQQTKAFTPVKILVITGGHDFERESFFSMFDSLSNIDYVEAQQKDDSEIFEQASNFEPYDVIIFYNFKNKLSGKGRENLLKLCGNGIGIVVLHHAIAGFDQWSTWPEIVGAQYFLKDTEIDGKVWKRSTFKHGVTFDVQVEKSESMVTADLKDFEIIDETYKGYRLEANNQILLTANEPHSQKEIGWTRSFRKSKVCYIQLGHGVEAYENESYRKLLSQAIKWSCN